MKWTYGIKNKLLASVILLVLCALVLLSNQLDRIHTEKVKASISTLYEDRLVAETYILAMTKNIYQIREILQPGRNPLKQKEKIDLLLAEFRNTYAIYLKTRLTPKEKATAAELIAFFNAFEQSLTTENPKSLGQADNTLNSLDKLSIIQIDESRLIMKEVEAQHATIKASSQFAFAIIIVILFVLQLLVFSSDTLVKAIRPNDPRLN